nr:RNA-directed DNA polymerase, eukaryota [Tanacetum cinerariifolium]
YFWSLESEGDYSVASICKLVDEKRFQEVGISTRWAKSVLSKVNITAWKIKTNALPTRFNLSQRGMDIDTLMCPVCKCGVETTSHLFFQCVLSKQIMRKVSSWWNVDYMDVTVNVVGGSTPTPPASTSPAPAGSPPSTPDATTSPPPPSPSSASTLTAVVPAAFLAAALALVY